VPQTAAPVEAGAASTTDAASEPAALTPTQATLVSIWSDVLGVQQIGIDQPFFSLGADSLQLFRIVARMNERGLGVDARQLMKNVRSRNSRRVSMARKSKPWPK
jgi:aryl carrier-like protein